MRAATVAALLSGVIVGGLCGGGLGGTATWWVMKGKGADHPLKAWQDEAAKNAKLDQEAREKEKKFGDDWLYGDIQKHLEGKGMVLEKVRCPLRSDWMLYFPPGTKYVDATARKVHPSGWEEMFAVIKMPGPKMAQAQAVTFTDESGMPCFVWSRFVFVSGPEVLGKVKKLLPPEGF